MSPEIATVEEGVLEKLGWIDGRGDAQRLGLMDSEVFSNLNDSVILFITSAGRIQHQLKCHKRKMQLFSPHVPQKNYELLGLPCIYDQTLLCVFLLV